MTPRITKEGNSVTVSEPSEYERLCEALANAIFANELMLFSQRTYMESMAVQLNEVGHPAAARAIREGIERAKAGEPPIRLYVGGKRIAGTATIEIKNPELSFACNLPDGCSEDSTKAPPPEDLSALKKRIGWERWAAEIWNACIARTREVTISERRFAYTFEMMMSYSFPEMDREQLRERLQALLDHEDEE